MEKKSGRGWVVSVCWVLLCAGVLSANVWAEEHEPVYETRPSVDFETRAGIGNTLAKLRAGESVNVAYLGGSITMADGWRPKTTARLQKSYPNAKIHEIHAAISGTGSYLGMFRLGRDVLQHKPDLLFVEFAVNDGGVPPNEEWAQMESIVRQTWAQNPETDIVFVYTFCVGFTKCVRNKELPVSASAMEMLADFYGIPSINFMNRVVQLESEGKLVFKPDDGAQAQAKIDAGAMLWSNDGTHPLDAGHELYLTDIERAFAAMNDLPPVNHASKLKTKFVENVPENLNMTDVTPEMLEGNWRKVEPTEPCFGFSRFLDTLWTTDEPGAKLTFQFQGSEAQIYDVVGPTAGQFRVTADGAEQKNPLSRCDAYCVNYYSFRITSSFIVQGLDPTQRHTVTLELLPAPVDRAALADGVRVKPEETKSEKYDGRSVWVGKILTK